MRNWQNATILKALGPVAVFSIPPRQDQVGMVNYQELPGIEHWRHHLVDFEEPTMVQKIGWWLHSLRHYRADLHYRVDIERDLQKTLDRFQPNLVVLSEIWLHRYLRTIKRHHCKLLLDEHNVEAPLFADNNLLAQGIKNRLKRSIEYHKIKAIEQDSIRQADRVWSCSETDTQLLKQLYGTNGNVSIVPNGVDISYYATIRSGQCPLPDTLIPHPHTLLFAATFGYPPNQVAAHCLIDEVFPRLQKRQPDCRLILAGKTPTPQMLAAAKGNPHIVITGMVEDIRPYLASASIVIVPLMQGGGTRLKILEAFAASRPVVSTCKGAEGLTVQDGQHLLIHNSVDELVQGVCDLWNDQHLGKQLVKNAFDLVKAEYSWESISHLVQQDVRELVN